jgi:CDP-4-dehydro-6-deoxyglucose reductase, E1
MENKKRILVGDIKLTEKEKSLILDILDSGRISEYKYVNKFENTFKELIGTKYCTLVNSGTSALIAGLLALIYDDRYPKIKKGAKVITTPLTYIATSNAIKLVGLEPVYVDVNLDNFSINVDIIDKLLGNSNSEEYAIILPVHLMGYPCDMDSINRIADKYDLVVFEDSAQAHGSKYKGKTTGNLSLLADYSFYIAHNIQVGEMGAIVTNDIKLDRLFRKIKANGRMCDCSICTRSQGYCQKQGFYDPRFTHDIIGYNFKTMEFQAAIGLCQLEKFDEIIKIRQRNVKLLNERLIKYSDTFKLPIYSEDISYLAYPLVIKDSKLNRNSFLNRLNGYGIESRPLFGCIPTQQPAYKDYKEKYEYKLDIAELLGLNAFYIGCHQYLEIEDIEYIGDVFDEIF